MEHCLGSACTPSTAPIRQASNPQLYLVAAALEDGEYSGESCMNGKYNVVQLDRVETSRVTLEIFFLKTPFLLQYYQNTQNSTISH